MSDFQIHALPYDSFRRYFTLPDALLVQRRASLERVLVTPGTPCRVSLQDARPGETALLVQYVHQPAETPFYASHAIYVRQDAVRAYPALNEIPPMLQARLLSLRGFDSSGMMRCADVSPGDLMHEVLRNMLEESAVDQVHIHTAKQGCYLARATRP